jgi:membrane protein implicated in regulation of membrane protease activity
LEDWTLWLIASIILLILEMFTPVLFLGSLAVSAFITAVFAYFGFNYIVQGIVFSLISIILTVFIRPLFKDFLLSSQNGVTNINKYIGKTAKVIQAINNSQETGRIAVYGEEWTSRSNDGENIEVGSIVEIKRIESMIVYVTKTKEQ